MAAKKVITTVNFKHETTTKGGVLRFKEIDGDGEFIDNYKETTMGTVYLRLPDGTPEPKAITVRVSA
jgi:hypothetical protein